ncbi:uncharacterized protein LOC132085629 [Ammospiza nelsoni]|uniref:uncharacterized protein LOC132085629 n=1 Tax=Ammospiza nelsoni TaxID=2857394 RepID=UPI00286B54F7|nr:uncharacterized protein LOC132085629 [Ammospiza nelsoni]
MEPKELSPALLQPQVTVMATLGELVALLPRWEGILLLNDFGNCVYRDLKDFIENLQVTLHRTEGTWWYRHVNSDDDDSLIPLSQALAAWESTPGTTQFCVIGTANKWQESVSLLVKSWAKLAGTATKLRNACRDLATKVADRVASTDTRAREMQAMAARYGTAQENMGKLGQALGRKEEAEVVAGHEAQGRGHAMEAASEATMDRQRVEAALGLLEHLVAACDEATVLPRDLRRLMKVIKAALERTDEASHNVRKDLVAKVAEAERLCEANARLVKGHLEGTLEAIKFLFDGDPISSSACGVAERCQRAIEDIPRLLRPPECPQRIPKVSPMSMVPQKVSPPQLQVVVAVVATLGEVVATVTGPHWGKFPDSLYENLKRFSRSLRAILNQGDVTSLGHPGVPSLRRALATLWATSRITWANVRAAASTWRELVAKLVDSWDWLAREATKLRDNHRKVITDQQLMVALDEEEVTWQMATHSARVAAAANKTRAEAGVATRRGHWSELALEPLQRLVAVCDGAILFNWNMEWQLRDIEALLKGINEASPDVLQALMAKVAKFEQLWEASTHLVKEHLLGTLEVIDNILLSPYVVLDGPGRRAVAERCQKAWEDIPRLLQESFT